VEKQVYLTELYLKAIQLCVGQQ